MSLTAAEAQAMRSRVSRYWQRRLGVRRQRPTTWDFVNRLTGTILVANIGRPKRRAEQAASVPAYEAIRQQVEPVDPPASSPAVRDRRRSPTVLPVHDDYVPWRDEVDGVYK